MMTLYNIFYVWLPSAFIIGMVVLGTINAIEKRYETKRDGQFGQEGHVKGDEVKVDDEGSHEYAQEDEEEAREDGR